MKHSLVLVLCYLLQLPLALAHLMPAQQGTLNIVDNAAYLVLNLPLTALVQLDLDHNNMISASEFQLQQHRVYAALASGIVLQHSNGTLPLQDMLLSPVTSHHNEHHSESSDIIQLTVLGKFTLPENVTDLRLQLMLATRQTSEKPLQLTITQKGKSTTQYIRLGAKKAQP